MYVYGKNTVCEYLKKNKKVQNAYIYDNFKDKFLISDLQKRDICIKYLSKISLSTNSTSLAKLQTTFLQIPSSISLESSTPF